MRYFISEQKRIDKNTLTLDMVNNWLNMARNDALIKIDSVDIQCRNTRTSKPYPIASYRVNGVHENLKDTPEKWRPILEHDIFEAFKEYRVIQFRTKYTGAGSLKIEIMLERPANLTNSKSEVMEDANIIS